MMRNKILFASVYAMLCLGACTPSKAPSSSTTKGLSATASASNVALLMSSYGSTPQWGSLFESDLQKVQEVVTDPAGNFRFKTYVDRQVSHHKMLSNIATAAKEVDREGTLLLVLVAHGAPNGYIQPADQAYATLGYSDILGAIKSGRNGQPFRRLVLIISACYSGSWMQTLQSSGGLFQERLVMTSVDATSLSYIGQSSSRFLQAFQTLRTIKNATVQDLVNTTKSYDPNVQFSAVPQSILSESLVTQSSPSQGNSQGAQVQDSRPENTGSTADSSTAQPSEQFSQSLTRTHLLTTSNETGDLNLYVYVPVENAKVEVFSASGWVEMTTRYVPHPGYPTIRSIPAEATFANESHAYVRVTVAGQEPVVIDCPITHRN